MKFILAVTDTNGKNLIFISREMQALYNLIHVVPHSEPKPDERGSQIALEFYQMATQWLQKP